MTTDNQSSEQVKGDGGRIPAAEVDLEDLKQGVKDINAYATRGIWDRRDNAEATRFCVWKGQSLDGRKHREALSGQDPFPFEGASDARIRTADEIVNERAAMMVKAATKGEMKVRPLESGDVANAGKVQTLLRYIRRNIWTADYRRELKKLAQFQEGDSPGAAVLAVFWRKEMALENKMLTLDAIAVQLLQFTRNENPTIQELDALKEMVVDPLREDEMVEWFGSFVPSLSDKRLREIIGDLRETGRAQFPMPYWQYDQPAIKALRLYEDFFFDGTASHFQRASKYYWRELLSETEVKERKLSHGYSEDFITEVMKHKGKTAFRIDRERTWNVRGDYTQASEEELLQLWKDKFEVITAFSRKVNDDGVPGIYTVPFHTEVDVPATDEILMPYKHGLAPFVYFAREVLTNAIIDTRGVPEIVVTDQNTQKLLHDSRNDHTQLATVPPVRVPKRSRARFVLGPLEQIEERRPGEVGFMDPPQYPQSNDVHQKQVERRVDRYFGRLTENVPRVLAELMTTDMVETFLDNVSDAWGMTLQLCQQYMPEEKIRRIVGGNGVDVPRTRQEIQGRFDTTLAYDIRDLDVGYVERIAKAISGLIAPMDRQSTIMYDKVVHRLMQALDPNLAEETLQPVEAANVNEIKDEELNFTKISAGIEPPMVPVGQNYALRLQVIMGIVQKNPQALQALTPMSKEILSRRVKHLQFMVQQQQNANIGRVGAEPATGMQGPGTPAGAATAPGGTGSAPAAGPSDFGRTPGAGQQPTPLMEGG